MWSRPRCNHEGNKRLEEYCPYDSDWFDGIHGTGKQYMDWLVNELKPAIDVKYPTLPTAGTQPSEAPAWAADEPVRDHCL